MFKGGGDSWGIEKQHCTELKVLLKQKCLKDNQVKVIYIYTSQVFSELCSPGGNSALQKDK